MESRYNEFADRKQYAKAIKLQYWFANRIIANFLLQAKVNPTSISMLEIGSGLGKIAKVSKEQGFKKYTAIEPNQILAEETRKAYGEGALVAESYLPDIPEGFENEFDLVLSFHVLEHAPDPYAAREWVEAMKNMVKPGGYILVSGPDIRDYKSSFWDTDWSHGYPLTPKRVEQIFRDLQIQTVCATTLHFGKTGSLSRILAHTFSVLLPTRILDSLTNKIVGRPLATGLKVTLLWGTTFVVGKVQ
jgi:2-polyprenyl-3-methyl-5-hydroxy-6-metoxy-1,4-benzoquinol methylase